MKKIFFKSEFPEFEILRPVPSFKTVPSWYRRMQGVNDGVMSVKKCVPFLDAFTAGYTIPLTSEVLWSKKDQRFSSNSSIEIITMHEKSQTEEVLIPQEYNPQPYKWSSGWFLQTPKGYSTLFTHPLNRLDLPFHSFSGVVDTDRHPMVINFPFVIKKDFDGKIEAGTPMIQAIPFKRDKWTSKIVDEGEPHFYPYTYKVMEPPFGYYKRNFWSRKEFK